MNAARIPQGSARALLPTLRRLHLAELVHLRALTLRLGMENEKLHAENERLQQDAWDADGRAEMFQDALIRAEDIQRGLTVGGELLVGQAVRDPRRRPRPPDWPKPAVLHRRAARRTR